MRATRRRLLQLPVLVTVAGCTVNPTVSGAPGTAPSPVPPTRGAEASAAATWAWEFGALIEFLASSAADWGADEIHTTWLAALASQSAAHLVRLVSKDPVVGGPTAFPTPSTAPDSPPTPATAEEAVSAVAAKAQEGMPVLRASLDAAGSGAERLLYASLATAVSGSSDPALPPVEGGAEPAPFPDPEAAGAAAIALSHVWALIRGVELGLGRLDRSEDLREAGAQRLDAARVLRNALLAALPGEPPDVETWDLPTALTTPEDIREAWAVLDGNVLDALGGVVAADPSESGTWLEAMLDQVTWVHRWRGRLPHWPGWVSA